MWYYKQNLFNKERQKPIIPSPPQGTSNFPAILDIIHNKNAIGDIGQWVAKVVLMGG